MLALLVVPLLPSPYSLRVWAEKNITGVLFERETDHWRAHIVVFWYLHSLKGPPLRDRYNRHLLKDEGGVDTRTDKSKETPGGGVPHVVRIKRVIAHGADAEAEAD